jgi:hypothetical protein
MGILREAILATTITKSDRSPAISCSGLFPCPYQLYLAHTGEAWEEPEPVQALNMKDGFDQEEQAVKRLKQAGIIVTNRDLKGRQVVIGRSRITGHIDGMVTLSSEPFIWEHKAMSSDRFWEFCNKGLEAMPNYYCQLQSYMLGKGVKKGILQAKNKDNNDIEDKVYNLIPEFINPIIEWADAIRLDNWIPKKEPCKWCTQCYSNCFGKVIDFSKIELTSSPEMVEKWATGKRLQEVGSGLELEAREFFVGRKDKSGNLETKGLLGDKDTLLVEGITTDNIKVEGLKISKIPMHRFDISKQKVVEVFGAEALSKVGEEKEIIAYRIEEWPKRRK